MIGVITNPYARGVVTDPLLPRRLAQIGGDRAIVVATRNLQEVSGAVRTFHDRGVDVVAACGGDGTNHSVLTEMIHVYGDERLPRFAILRGGTVNTVADNLEIYGSPEDILTRLLACRSRGMVEPVEERPLLDVNGARGFLFGAAVAARFFDAYHNSPFHGLTWASLLAGKLAASALAGTAFARRVFHPVRAQVRVDGHLLPLDQWTVLLAATVENVGLGLHITYRALEREGAYHLVASGLPPFEIARQLPRAFISRSLSGEPHFDLLAHETVIEFEQPEPYMMDGDLFRASRLVLRMGPQVRISVP